MADTPPSEHNEELSHDLAVQLCDELGAAEVITSYDPPYGKYMTIVTYSDGHQVQGSGDSPGGSIENARQAAIIDKGSR